MLSDGKRGVGPLGCLDAADIHSFFSRFCLTAHHRTSFKLFSCLMSSSSLLIWNAYGTELGARRYAYTAEEFIYCLDFQP